MSLGTAAGLVALVLQVTADFRLDISRLSPDEITQIERLADGRFWLVLGHQGGTDVEVYRLPETTGPTLRRGQMVRVIRPLETGPAAAEPRVPPRWHPSTSPWASASWAQVRLAGRDFDDVSGPQDRNRPFMLYGTFRDSEVVTLVEFIRSGPEERDAGGRRSWDPALPIGSFERRADGSVVVGLRISEYEGQIVMVKPAGGTWVFVDGHVFIA